MKKLNHAHVFVYLSNILRKVHFNSTFYSAINATLKFETKKVLSLKLFSDKIS